MTRMTLSKSTLKTMYPTGQLYSAGALEQSGSRSDISYHHSLLRSVVCLCWAGQPSQDQAWRVCRVASKGVRQVRLRRRHDHGGALNIVSCLMYSCIGLQKLFSLYVLGKAYKYGSRQRLSCMCGSLLVIQEHVVT
jgi:hypothetical protein